MTLITNVREIFNEHVSGYLKPGQTTIYDYSEKIDLDACPLNGGFLVKNLYLSVEPLVFGRMRNPETYKLGPPCYQLGKPIEAFGVGVVIRSEDPSVKVGDHITGVIPFQLYFVRQQLHGLQILQNEANLPLSVYLGVCGLPGLTAYCGWKEFAFPKPGETVFVTAGAGPVGSTVIQLAKRDGLKVIACAGSDQKLAWMKEIGADVVFNYKTQDTKEILEKEGPINIYWDNVGGDILDAALDAAAKGARFIECGMASGYGAGFTGVKNLMNVIVKDIKMTGFVISTLMGKHGMAFRQEMPALVAKGEIKYKEDRTWGLENSSQALLDVMTGKSNGKKVIVLAEE